MSSYEDRRREEARRRLAARQGSDRGQHGSDEGRYREYDSYGSNRGRAASLRSLHNVSPEMRERYSATANPGSSGRRANRGGSRQASRYDVWDEWDAYDDVTWDDGRGSRPDDWRSPSVDAIGGRRLDSSRGGSGGVGGALSGFFGRMNGPLLIGALVVLVLLVAVIAVAANSCSAGEASQDEQAAQQEQSEDGTSEGGEGQQDSSSSSTENEIDRAKLEKIMETDTVDKLLYRASASEDAKWIAQHPEAYAGDGKAVQRKLLKLAADEPAACSFVRNYPDKYPMDTPQSGSVNTVATGKGIPRLYQWDALWGYTTYSGTSFGLTGCCPTALSMVYQGLTGKTDLSPFDMGELAERDGYMTENEGTIASFLVDEAPALGLSCSTIDVTSDALKKALQSGQVVIVNFAPGIFTEGGHYVVITGMTQDGSLVMNDPYSEERSSQTWGIDTIVNESIGFYAYG